MISRVKIQNFKSIGEPGVDLELKPLTFLVGPNGGGKSNILDAIVFASQKGTPEYEFLFFSNVGELHFKHESNKISVMVEIHASPSGEVGAYEVSSSKEDVLHQELLPRLNGRTDITKDSFRIEDVRILLEGNFFKRVFPIRATRGTIQSRTGHRRASWVGTHGENTLEILEKLPDAAFRPQKDRIIKWASEFGMPYLAATLSDREWIKGSYADDKLDTALNLASAGSGDRQILPVIVQLFWADKDSTVVIEEPEISLHPALQIRLLQMFSEAISEGKQIIVTTHSHFLLQAIGYAINKGWLSHERIVIHHVQKTEEGTKTDSLPLGENGYIEGWVPSFTDVERQLLREWAETLPRE